ncbi:MAG TPA: helix-turn-helix domain-containing protein [Anaerovoracaceae bacterium]|nr:helix-turn-helix domain-containing protein [Anaerovoracaceae bacterium]
MINGYMTAQEAAQKWKITQRQVQILCKSGRIGGVVQMGRMWLIPQDSVKPTAGKKSPDIKGTV